MRLPGPESFDVLKNTRLDGSGMKVDERISARFEKKPVAWGPVKSTPGSEPATPVGCGKSGRPAVKIDLEKVQELGAKSLTVDKIAAAMGLSSASGTIFRL